ncbi:MAG: uridine diphosphate-N-acetylglucosamine-binding protein YvcK [Actinomycetota bacterium]
MTEAGPRVVALGGGHGLAVTLRAVRRYASDITAIVSVADDGGSSGRLRRALDVPAPGDLRRCLVALAEGAYPWPDAFEHRFEAGELAGHALGNLILVGLAETLGGLEPALAAAGRLLGAVGTVLPATERPVALVAETGGEAIEGQVAVARAGSLRTLDAVRLEPSGVAPPVRVPEAIGAADQVVIAPGSLFTSVLAVLAVPEIARAVRDAPGCVVQIANLAAEAETTGLTAADHVRRVAASTGRIDAVLWDPGAGLGPDEDAAAETGARSVVASVAAPDGRAHDPERLAQALASLM